jgi:RNA polymerase sigma factor for flagellar operon FliA
VVAEDPYLADRELIESVLGAVCRRHRLYGVDAEDFSSIARLHLIDDGHRVLRRFEGRSSLRTYLTIVITRCYQDWRNARWGKWRVSAEARRMGPLAEHLERLIVRDRLTLDEAWETLCTNGRLDVSRRTLEEMAARFPARISRHAVSDEALLTVTAETPGADARLTREEAAREAEDVSRWLTEAVDRLPAQDKLIVRMRFQDDFTIADIARALQIDARALYRRVSSILTRLGDDLTARGVDRDTARHLLSQGGFRDDVAPSAPETSGQVRLPMTGDAAPTRQRPTP